MPTARIGPGSKIGNSNVVLVRQRKSGKLSTPFDPRLVVVTNRKGSMITARRHDASTVTRNVSMFHTLSYESAEDHPVVLSEYNDPEMASPGEEPKMVIVPGSRFHRWSAPSSVHGTQTLDTSKEANSAPIGGDLSVIVRRQSNPAYGVTKHCLKVF